MSDPSSPLSALIQQNAPAAPAPDDDEQTGGGQPNPNLVTWNPDDAAEDYDIRLADGSIRPMSQSRLESLAMQLRQSGSLDVRHLLEWLNVPDADEIADAVEQEQKLAALAKIKK